ncbi:MAG: hypothetical protein IPI49_25965 [Myxococcales bacterium]|nr:hypothetical protein [Myxococcales bacterium]
MTCISAKLHTATFAARVVALGAALGLLGSAQRALAQDAPAATDEPAADAGAEDLGFSSAASAQPAPAVAEERAVGSWGTRFIDRPRTLPQGMIEAGGYLDYSRYTETTTTGEVTVSSTALTAAAGYGVTSEFELRASYGVSLDPSRGKGPFAVGAGFGFSEGSLAIAADGDFSYDLQSETGGIGLGARVRYKITPALGLYTRRQLVMNLIGDGQKPAELHLPLGAGYQVNDQLYAFAETELAQLNLRHSTTLAIFADYLPLTVGAVYVVSPKLEFGGTLYTDLRNSAFDALSIGGFGRAYF